MSSTLRFRFPTSEKMSAEISPNRQKRSLHDVRCLRSALCAVRMITCLLNQNVTQDLIVRHSCCPIPYLLRSTSPIVSTHPQITPNTSACEPRGIQCAATSSAGRNIPPDVERMIIWRENERMRSESARCARTIANMIGMMMVIP